MPVRASVTIVLERTYSAWAARDLEGTLAWFADDVTFIIHLPPEVAPYVGEVKGKANLAPRLGAILDEFDFVEYVPLQIRADGDACSSRIRFHHRHRATGLDYEGTMRHVCRVAGDRITRFEEFHDAERLRTFMRLVGQARREEEGG
jgi:ketosteroid isomerase-like protein